MSLADNSAESVPLDQLGNSENGFTRPEKNHDYYGVHKQTLIPSPIIKYIFHVRVPFSRTLNSLKDLIKRNSGTEGDGISESLVPDSGSMWNDDEGINDTQMDDYGENSQNFDQDINFEIEEDFDKDLTALEAEMTTKKPDFRYPMEEKDTDIENTYSPSEDHKTDSNKPISNDDHESSSYNYRLPFQPRYREVLVIIRETSITMDGNTMLLPSPLRNATLIPGKTSIDPNQNTSIESIDEEDSLLLSLCSGMLIIVQLFLDMEFPDDSDEYSIDRLVENATIVPRIVQHHQLFSNREYPRNTSLGSDICVDPLSRAVAISASKSWLRIYKLKKSSSTNNVTQLTTFRNFKMDGIILFTCFFYPFTESKGNKDYNEHYVMLFILSITSNGKYRCSLLNFWADQPFSKSYIYPPLPLPSSFKLPILTVPTKDNGVVLVMEDELFSINAHHIMSGSLEFLNQNPVPFPSFPLTYYKPTKENNNSMLKSSKGIIDQFYMSTITGMIYSIVVKAHELSVIPITRISYHSLGCALIFERYDNSGAYNIIYGGDTIEGKSLLISKVLKPTPLSNLFTKHFERSVVVDEDLIILDKYENWAPVQDFDCINTSIIHSNDPKTGFSGYSSDELWLISGYGDKGSLINLRTGFKGEKVYASRLKDTNKIFCFITLSSNCYVIFSQGFSTTGAIININHLKKETQSMQKMIDLEDDCGLDFGSTTYAISPMTDIDACIQITSNSVCITDFQGTQLRIEMLDIIEADIHQNTIAIILKKFNEDMLRSEYYIQIFKVVVPIDEDTPLDENCVQQVSEIHCEDIEVTFIKFLEICSQVIVVIGSYSYLTFYSLSDDKELRKFQSIKVNEIAESETPVPNDIIFAKAGDMNCLFIALRDGSYIKSKLVSNNGKIQLFDIKTIRLSNMPVSFNLIPSASNPKKDKSILLVSQGTWQLSLDKYENYPKRVIVEGNDHSVISASIIKFNFDPVSDFQLYDSIKNYIVMIRDNGFLIVRLNQFLSVCLKRIKIGSTPRKLIYLSYYGVFAITCKKSNTSKEGPQHLCFVDPKRGSRVSANILLDFDTKTPIFEQCDEPISLADWVVSSNGKKYCQLLVGCESDRDVYKGRIYALRLKTSPLGELIVWKAALWDTNNSVLAISQFKESSFVHSSGQHVMKRNLDLESRKIKREFISYDMRSIVSSITPRNNELYVSTIYHSLRVIDFGDGEVEDYDFKIYGDRLSRKLVNSVPVNDNVIALADKDGFIIGLGTPGDRNGIHETIRTVVPCLFSVRIPSVPKVKIGCFIPPWLMENKKELNQHLSVTKAADTTMNSLAEHRFVSCGLGGDVIGYTLLSSDEFFDFKENDRSKLKEEDGLHFWELDYVPNTFTESHNDKNVIDTDNRATWDDSVWVNDRINSIAL